MATPVLVRLLGSLDQIDLLAEFGLRAVPCPGDAEETQLAEADLTGRARASARVAAELRGLDPIKLRQKCGTTTPLILEVDGQFLDRLDATRRLDHALTTTDCQPDHVRLVDGTNLHPIPGSELMLRPSRSSTDLARLRPFAIAEGLQRGVTLIANNVTPRVGGELGLLVNDLVRATGTTVGVNTYVSERGARGFGCHWDDHDVIIIQCRGAKKWTIFEPRELSPIKEFVPNQDAGGQVLSTVLEPGAGLYIPRGWSHEVAGFPGDVSVHYTISVRPPTTLDFLHFQAISAERVDGPETASPPEDLGSCVFDRDRFTQWIAAQRATLGVEPDTGMLSAHDALAEDLTGLLLRAPMPGGAIFADSSKLRAKEVAIVVSGNVLAFDRRVASTVGRLLAGEDVDIADEACRLDLPLEEMRAMFRLLLALDVVLPAGAR